MSLREALYWSEEEVLEQLMNLLPEGWGFSHEFEDRGGWRGKITDSQGTVLWEEAAMVPKLLFLNAYGWLFKRVRQPSLAPLWAPRKEELTMEVVRKAAEQQTLPDPEDLNPCELETVYSLRNDKTQ